MKTSKKREKIQRISKTSRKIKQNIIFPLEMTNIQIFGKFL